MNTLSQPHILLIDDQPDETQGLHALLHRQECRLTLAGSGQQGLQRAQALLPDLILMDVRMPQMDGFTVCRLLKEEPRTRHIPVIFLTSAASPEERLEGLTHGGVDYVLKPCLPEEVLARVRIHLRLAQRSAGQPSAQTPESLLSPDEIVLRAAVRFIGQQLAELPSLEDIARKAGTHGKRLSALFQQHMGMTVFAFVREERLRRGRELLADTGLNMQEIANLTGFRSACNFTTAFRERMGMTPSQFRRNMQAESGRSRA